MELESDAEIIKWINQEWDGTLDWDLGNVTKLAKHDVAVDEVESIFDGQFLVGKKIIGKAGDKWREDRFTLYGQTESGRKLTIIWTPRGARIRPISCRSVRKNESKEFQRRKD